VADSIQEYVIKLGAEIDNQGVTKLLSLLDSSKLKALGITAAITAATTAVYKFVESATKQELELQKLAEKQKKSVEATRASETALKQMGMTLKEIQKDKALKGIYDDIVKFNESLALPDMKNAIARINGLRGAFWKLKSAVQYSVQWINAKVLTNLAAPIERITNKLTEASGWIANNLTSITTKISGYITGFAKGIIGIVEGFEKITKYVSDLPEGVKRIGTAIGAVFALLKSGPIGQILAAITMIGDVIHDYEVFQWNKAHPDQDPVAVAYAGIWERLENDDYVGIIDKLVETLTGAFTSIAETLDSIDIGEFLNDPAGKLGSFVDELTAYFNVGGAGEGKLEALGSALWTFISSALSFGGRGVADIAGELVKIFTDPNMDSEIDAALGTNTVATGLGTGVLLKLLGVGDIGAIAGGIVASIADAKKKAEISFQGKHPTQAEIDEKTAEILGFDAKTFGQGVLDLLLFGLSCVEDVGTKIYGAIAESMADDTAAKNVFSTLSGNGNGSTIGDALVDGLLAGLTTGNFLLGLAGFFGRIAADIAGGKGDQVQAELSTLGQNLAKLLFGDGENDIGLFGAIGAFFDGLWNGEDGKDNGLKKTFEDLGTKIVGWLSPVGDAIVNWAQGIWRSVQDILFGPMIDVVDVDEKGRKTRTKTRDSKQGLLGEIQKLWSGEDGTGGLKNWIVTEAKRIWEGTEEGGGLENWLIELGNNITTWLEPVKNAVIEFFDGLWLAIYNKAPDWVLTALGFVGVEDPNKSTFEKKGNRYTMTSTNENSRNLTQEQYDFLSPYADYLSIDKDGNVKLTGKYEGLGHAVTTYEGNSVNDMINHYLNGTDWAQDPFGVRNLFGVNGKVTQNMLLELFSGKFSGFNLNKNAITPEEEENAEDAAGAVGDLGNKSDAAAQQVAALGEACANAAYQVGTGGGGGSGPAAGKSDFAGGLFNAPQNYLHAMGGRIGSEKNGITVGEDGTEYIIPITKPNRAFTLINQMLNEMGSSAIHRVVSGLGIGAKGVPGKGGSIASALSSFTDYISGNNTSNMYTISAPVSIVVNANGADGEAIGRTAYNAAETHLFRTLRGVTG